MIDRVDFETEAFLEPFLQAPRSRLDLARHDGERSPAIDLLESPQDRPQERFVLLRISHIVDGQDDDGLDAILANPLRRRQLGKCARDVIGIVFIQIGEPIPVRGEGR